MKWLLCCLLLTCSFTAFAQPPIPGKAAKAPKKLSLPELVHSQVVTNGRHPSTNVTILKQVTVQFKSPLPLFPHYRTSALLASTNKLGPFTNALAIYPNDYTTHDTLVSITNHSHMWFRAANLYTP